MTLRDLLSAIAAVPARAAAYGVHCHDVMVDHLLASDPVHAAIEARRASGGGAKVLLSRELDLDVTDLFIQCDRREAASETLYTHRLLPLLHTIQRRPIRRTATEMRYRYQRLTRGWDDTAVWALDRHLARTLSAQLYKLATDAHGWPADDTHPTFEDWTAAITAAADKLHRYAHPEGQPARRHHLAMLGRRDVTRAESDAALDADVAEERDIAAGARDALHWVADNLGGLWD